MAQLIREYHSIVVEAHDDEALDRMIKLACSIPSYHRIYIDEFQFYDFDDPVWNQYSVEILFANEQDATLFHLKL